MPRIKFKHLPESINGFQVPPEQSESCSCVQMRIGTVSISPDLKLFVFQKLLQPEAL